jgi:integrase
MKLSKGISVRGDSFVAYVTVNGKPVRKVVGQVGCITPKQAAQERTDLLRNIRNGKYPPAPTPIVESMPESPVVTVTDLWTPYLADCSNREKRVDRLQTAWNHLEDFFGNTPATSIKTQDMVTYTTARRAQKITNGTVNRELAVLKALLRHGARSGVIEKVPLFPKRLPESKPRSGFVTEEQYAVLAKNAKELWLRTFVALGFNFGFRKSELLTLRVRNIDFLDGWLAIETSKNGDGRKVKLTQETLSLLVECARGKSKNDFVLTREDGSRFGRLTMASPD